MDKILLEIEKLTKKLHKNINCQPDKNEKKLKKNGYNVEMDVFHVFKFRRVFI